MRTGTVLVAAVLVAAGCNADRQAVPAGEEETGVARTYAPELNVDLDRMERLPSGLYYEDLVEGSGPAVEQGQTVVVHYTGWLPDGTQFDSSRDRGEPFSTPIGEGRVIRGWDEGMQGMRVGGQRILVIPYEMAYGESGRGAIPPRATLVFDVELLQIR